MDKTFLGFNKLKNIFTELEFLSIIKDNTWKKYTKTFDRLIK